MNLIYGRLSLLLCLFTGIVSCGDSVTPERADKTPEEIKRLAENPALSNSLTAYLTAEESDYLVRLHQGFSAGVQKYFPERPLAFAYQQNLVRIRLQMLEKQTINHIFPFGEDDLRLGYIGDPPAMSFLSSKCGFADDSTKLTVHYPCLDKAAKLLDYFAEAAGESPFIKNFVERYRKEGFISDAMKSGLILGGEEELDFSNPHQQLFYGFFQLLVIEEMEAAKRFRKQLADG